MERDNPKIAAVVLAAGASQRFGQCKQLIRLNGKPLLQHALDPVLKAGIDEVILVLGTEAEAILKEIDVGRARAVRNDRPEEGMSRSLKIALAALSPATEGALIILADQPFVSPETMAALIDIFRKTHPAAVIPTYNGFRGNPVLLSRSLFDEMQQIEGNIGCRALFGNHPGRIVKVAVDDPGVIIDIDTPEDFERAAEGKPKGPSEKPNDRAVSAVPDDLSQIEARLRRIGTPFARATVVRAERPTSAKPGDKAIVQEDGALHGWIGGSCARDTVIEKGIEAIRGEKPLFLRITPRKEEPMEGMETVPMPCYSGGTIDLFIEPQLPNPPLIVLGRDPVAAALVRLGKAMQFDVTLIDPLADPNSFPAADRLIHRLDLPALEIGARAAVIVATHGRFDEEAIEQAVGTGAGYIALVASRKRADAVLRRLRERGISPEALGRVKSPAGLNLGAETAEEIALSILAEIVQLRRAERKEQPKVRREDKVVAKTKDPICGMMVDPVGAEYKSEYQGKIFYFCCEGCKAKFDAAPAAHAA